MAGSRAGQAQVVEAASLALPVVVQRAADRGRAESSGGSGLDTPPHHPAPLRDLAVALEAEVGEEVLGAGVEVRAALRLAALDLLRVCLDQTSARLLDRLERAGYGGAGDAPAAVRCR